MKVGTEVATLPVPVPGTAVQQWICAAVLGPSNPLKLTFTSMVCKLVSNSTVA